MAFVDTLEKSNIPYDYNKRAIYPLFKDLQLPLHSDNIEEYLRNLKQIVRANYRFCLLGLDDEYVRLLSVAGNSQENLQKFKDKYSAFFIEDFKWTHFNYENMCKKADSIALWWLQIQPLLPSTTTSSTASAGAEGSNDDNNNSNSRLFYTIDEVIDLLQLKDIWFQHTESESKTLQVIDAIFEYVVEKVIFPLFQPTEVKSKAYRLDRAFRRYLVGQCAIFAKFDFIPESRLAFNGLLDVVNNAPDDRMITLDVINEVRGKYDTYLQLLLQKNLISSDDQVTFSESYPLFDAMYLSYDQDHSQMRLADVAKDILLSSPVFTSESEHQFAYHLLSGYKLNKQEMFYLRMMHVLLEYSDGQVVDNVFVTQPGVILLSELENQVEHPSNLLTFLIAGVSVECSLELIAHKEVSVARLTTSKTNAMNLPMYRIYPHLHCRVNEDQNTVIQKQYIRDVQYVRQQYQVQYDQINQQRSKKDTQEMLNMFNEANKCTFLCYSMPLQDLHKLFIGRSAFDGNESEVREVIKKMHTIAHARYPNIIRSWNSYINANNLSKVQADSTAAAFVPPVLVPGMQSAITHEAKRLFAAVNINTEQPEYLQLADFRSRITYLSFPKSYNRNVAAVLTYHRKIILELGHMSVLGAYQVVTEGERVLTTKEAITQCFKAKEVGNGIDPTLQVLLHELLVK